MKYLLDTNIFIDSYKRYYQFSFCPGFWDFLEQEKAICSVDKVYEELSKNGQKTPKEFEEFFVWLAKQKEDDFFKENSKEIENNVKKIMGYVNRKYTNEKIKHINKNEIFFNGADPFLIATAMSEGVTVVTSEERVKDSSNVIKIPNVCVHFKVKYLKIYQLLEKFKPEFILKK